MRILHTSDWHLGRSLHRADLREAQAGFLASLTETVRSERVDVVLVSGDVYDRAVPSLDAVALCEEALVGLRAAGAQVIVTSGNHDSATRLGFGSRLFAASGVHVRTSAARVAEPILVSDGAGEVGFYALPYLEPESARVELPAEPDGAGDAVGRGHPGVLRRAMACVRADADARRLGRRVVLAHAWVSGGFTSESERDISIGGVGHVGADLFDGVDYAALGHLHGPQVIHEAVRYSGSPLPYSFGEADQQKGSWLVELDAAGLGSTTFVPAPVPRRLATVRGRLDELLSDASHEALRDCYLRVVLTDPGRPVDPMARLARRFPHVLVMEHAPEGSEVVPGSYRSKLAGRDDLAILRDFVTHVRGAAPTDEEHDLLHAAADAVSFQQREVA